MRGKIAKALRRITRFHPNTERLYNPLMRNVKVATPNGDMLRETLLRFELDPKGPRKFYKNVKARFKSLSSTEKTPLSWTKKTRARAYA